MASLTTPISKASQEACTDSSDDAFVSTTREKILVTQAEETCLASLFCRVQDARSTHPVLGDAYAQKTFDRCEVDRDRRHLQQSRSLELYNSHVTGP